MRVTILLFCCSALAIIGGFGKPATMQTARSTHQTNADPNAAALWEQAIEAKGGRARLHSVANILESYSDKSAVSLYVFPSKLWEWTDDRPTPLGVYVEMINLERDLSYIIREDSGVPANKGKYSAKGRGEWPLSQIQLCFLLETHWVKPVPVVLLSGTIRGKAVDVVQTLVNGDRVDFHLDKKSHLPLEVAFPAKDSIGTKYGLGTYYATFSDYYDVSGIQMPGKVGHDAEAEISQSVQVNVDYDAGIFERPPSLKDGPDGWRIKKQQNKSGTLELSGPKPR
jgi:hypothetical protein